MSNWITVRPTRNLRRPTPFWADPFADEAFNWVFGTPRRTVQTGEATFNFKLNVAQDEANYYIYAVIPGADAQKLDVSVLDKKLTIAGEIAPAAFGPQTETAEGTTEGENQPKVSWLHRELPAKALKFSRELTLPTDLNADDIAAHYENGVLRLRVAKAAEVQPRRVAVTSA
jgi:HSP20 family protein